MAILNMQRIEILALLTESKSLVDYVQRKGIVEITDYTESQEHFYNLPTDPTISQFERFGATAAEALDILSVYQTEKTSLLDSFIGRPGLTVSEYDKKVSKADERLSDCYTVCSLKKEIQDAHGEIARCRTLIDQLSPWLGLDISPSFKGTEKSSVFIGSLEGDQERDWILESLAEVAPDINGEIEVISHDKLKTCMVALCHKDYEKEFEQALRTIGFIAMPDSGGALPKDRKKELERRINRYEADIKGKQAKLEAYAKEKADFQFLEDYFALKADKYRALSQISMDEKVFILTGYIKEKDAEKFKKDIEKKFSAAVSVFDVDPEDENVPVAVENGKVAKTLEPITDMYSVPSHKDIDPNRVMSIFYFCLFGLMLGDAGYGLIMIILCLIIKHKKKPEPEKMNLVNYGLYCGIGTFVWGALQNSWFGDLPKWIANGLKSNAPTDFLSRNHIYWFQPLDGHIPRFLLLCFFIGILHLFLAVCVNIYKNCVFHRAFNGFVENVPFLLILIGVIPVINTYIGNGALAAHPSTKPIDDFIVSYSGILYGCLKAGAILVIIGPSIVAIKEHKSIGKIFAGIGEGLYGLYNAASGYLGDILSYARLLALGLCTGVIASVINQLAAMPMEGNAVMFIIIAVIGHAVNLFINIIGAYVHTNRLQYVEFFSKFYEGGGEAFEPLQAETKSFHFKEEI